MNKNTMMMVAMATVLFFVILVGYGMKNKKDGWQFGNWGNTDGVEQKMELPQAPEVNTDEEEAEPRKQIIAATYDEALVLSKEHNMQILIVFHADWCGWCTKMKETTLSDEAVKEAMKNYVFLSVDTDKNNKMRRKFRVRGLPSYAVVNDGGEKLKSGNGYKDAEAFLEWLK